jgi:hypothetical protein
MCADRTLSFDSFTAAYELPPRAANIATDAMTLA